MIPRTSGSVAAVEHHSALRKESSRMSGIASRRSFTYSSINPASLDGPTNDAPGLRRFNRSASIYNIAKSHHKPELGQTLSTLPPDYYEIDEWHFEVILSNVNFHIQLFIRFLFVQHCYELSHVGKLFITFEDPYSRFSFYTYCMHSLVMFRLRKSTRNFRVGSNYVWSCCRNASILLRHSARADVCIVNGLFLSTPPPPDYFFISFCFAYCRFQPDTCPNPACDHDPILCPNTEICAPEIPLWFSKKWEMIWVAVFTLDFICRISTVALVPARCVLW